jgi:hypothetical protein
MLGKIMKLYTTEGDLLYASTQTSIQETIEEAISTKTILDKIDLKNKDLRNIDFDTAIIRGASFQDADLTGANMSEAIFDFSNFSGSQLYNTCFAYSSLNGCMFLDSLFGATDFSETIIDHCLFSGPSTFSIIFRSVSSMINVKYFHENIAASMHTPPMHIRNDTYDAAMLDEHIIMDNQIYSHEFWKNNGSTLHPQNSLNILYKKLIKHEKFHAKT